MHEPNLCIVHNEAGDDWIFEDDTTQKEFCKWLFTDEHIGCTMDFQGYDSYFILQYLTEQGLKYEVIMLGGKTLSLEVPMFNIPFIDSLNFIAMKLANFPKMFGIKELTKGYFPHLFNKKGNENYVCPIPPTLYYNRNGMSPIDGRHPKKRAIMCLILRKRLLCNCQSDGIFYVVAVWNFADCFKRLPKSICSVPLPLRPHAIKCTAAKIF